MIIEMNVQYAVIPGKERRVLEILKDLRSRAGDHPHEVLQEELLWGRYSIGDETTYNSTDYRDCTSKIWAFLETPAKVRVHFRA